MGFVCPCPPIRNDIVTPLHLLCVFSHIYKRSCPPICWLVGLSITQMVKLLKTNVSDVLFIPVTSKKLPTSVSIQSLFILSFIHSFIHSIILSGLVSSGDNRILKGRLGCSLRLFACNAHSTHSAHLLHSALLHYACFAHLLHVLACSLTLLSPLWDS